MESYSVHSENGIAPKKNTNTVYSEYSYSGIVPKEHALKKWSLRARETEKFIPWCLQTSLPCT